MKRSNRKCHRPEEVVAKLRQADEALAAEKPIAEVARSLGVSEVTPHRWRAEYGVPCRRRDPADNHCDDPVLRQRQLLDQLSEGIRVCRHSNILSACLLQSCCPTAATVAHRSNRRGPSSGGVGRAGR